MTVATTHARWVPIRDPPDRFSTGVPDLDRHLGGGFPRGSVVLVQADHSIGPEELRVLFTPLWLNFLGQSRGALFVLPARESPAEFRQYLLGYTTRRLFDSRVRIVDYVGEGPVAPYVVHLPREKKGKRPVTSLRRMAAAEVAVRGARQRPFLEWNALEMIEDLFGADVATRMLLFGTKRIRGVGNLGILVARPGLVVGDAARGFADVEIALRRVPGGIGWSGIRPATPERVVAPNPSLAPPNLYLRAVGG